MARSTFRDLIAWQKALRLTVAAYEFSEKFPQSERFGLTQQLRRSAVSVPSNIAEGRGRGAPRDYRQFLYNARGSLCELQTQIVLARELGYQPSDLANPLITAAEEVHRLINGLIRYLEQQRGA